MVWSWWMEIGLFYSTRLFKYFKNMINVLASETFSAVSAPIQYAAIKAYKNDHSIILINLEIF